MRHLVRAETVHHMVKIVFRPHVVEILAEGSHILPLVDAGMRPARVEVHGIAPRPQGVLTEGELSHALLLDEVLAHLHEGRLVTQGAAPCVVESYMIVAGYITTHLCIHAYFVSLFQD